MIEVKDENWRAGTGIYKVSDDCLQIEFERFLPSDPSYNIENSEVGDHHGLDIVHTSGAGMMSSVAQLWSVDQAGTHLWTPGNICFYLRRIVLFVFLNARGKQRFVWCYQFHTIQSMASFESSKRLHLTFTHKPRFV